MSLSPHPLSPDFVSCSLPFVTLGCPEPIRVSMLWTIASVQRCSPTRDSKELPLMLVSKTYVEIGPFHMVKRQSIWVWYDWTPCQGKKRSPGTGQHPGKNPVTSGPRSEWQSHRHADDWQLTPEVSHSMESLLCGTREEPVSLDGLLMYSKHLELPRNICIDLSHLIYPVSQKPLQTNGLFLPELGHFKCEKPRAIFPSLLGSWSWESQRILSKLVNNLIRLIH